MLSVDIESAFEVCYLGMVQNVNLGVHLSQKSDVLLIDKIEEAQVDLLNIYRGCGYTSGTLHITLLTPSTEYRHRHHHRSTCLNTANHRKSPQFTANQVQVTSVMPQLTANQYKHRISQQITANQSMSA